MAISVVTKKRINLDNIGLIFEGGAVKRFHTFKNGAQNNAEHQWRVAMIVALLEPSASRDLILEALTHDTYECITGDVPSTAKDQYPGLKEMLCKIEESLDESFKIKSDKLTEYDRFILKLADHIEAYLFANEMFSKGHVEYSKPAGMCLGKIRELIADKDVLLVDVVQKLIDTEFWGAL